MQDKIVKSSTTTDATTGEAISNGQVLSFATGTNRNIEVRYITSKKYNLRNILEDLSSIGICNLLVEGGAKIFSSFIKENLFDEIFLFRGNFFIGDGGLNAVNSEKNNFLSKKKFSIRESIRFGNDSLEILNSLKKNNQLDSKDVFGNN